MDKEHDILKKENITIKEEYTKGVVQMQITNIKTIYHLTATRIKHIKLAFNFCKKNKVNICKINTMTINFIFNENIGYIYTNTKDCFNRPRVDKQKFTYILKKDR